MNATSTGKVFPFNTNISYNFLVIYQRALAYLKGLSANAMNIIVSPLLFHIPVLFLTLNPFDNISIWNVLPASPLFSTSDESAFKCLSQGLLIF